MKEVDGYIFADGDYDDDVNSTTIINASNCEEIIYRKSFFDIDSSGLQFLNHVDFVAVERCTELKLPPEEFNFPPSYRRVVHVDEVLGDHRTILGTGSALPEMFEKDEIEQSIPEVEKRIAQKVGDMFDRNFLNNVEVKESSIPNVIN